MIMMSGAAGRSLGATRSTWPRISRYAFSVSALVDYYFGHTGWRVSMTRGERADTHSWVMSRPTTAGEEYERDSDTASTVGGQVRAAETSSTTRRNMLTGKSLAGIALPTSEGLT